MSHNPFAARRFAPGALPWFETDRGTLARLVERASRTGARHQILGPHGSGKSSLLVQLEREANQRGLRVLRVRGSQLRWRELWGRRLDLVLLDEAEELGAFSLVLVRSLVRLAGAALVVTAHRDLGLETLARREVDPALAARVVGHLLRATPWAPPPLPELAARLERQRGNLREVLFELYDEIERAGDHCGTAAPGKK